MYTQISITEAQAQRHSAQRTMSESSSSNPASSGEIVNNIGTMEYNNQTRVFSASFRYVLIGFLTIFNTTIVYLDKIFARYKKTQIKQILYAFSS